MMSSFRILLMFWVTAVKVLHQVAGKKNIHRKPRTRAFRRKQKGHEGGGYCGQPWEMQWSYGKKSDQEQDAGWKINHDLGRGNRPSIFLRSSAIKASVTIETPRLRAAFSTALRTIPRAK